MTERPAGMEGAAIEQFEAFIQKDDAGRLTFFEIPFNAKEQFCKPKGTIYVSGTLNGLQYRGKLLSRGGGKFLMVIDKALQKAIGFDEQAMTAHITMSSEELEPAGKKQEEPAGLSSGMDVLTAIKTRQSKRKFTSRPVEEDMVTALLCCGLYAPTAKNKRPYHFIVIRNRQLLAQLASQNPQGPSLSVVIKI